MATIDKAKEWHRNRATLLHDAFLRVAQVVEIEGAKIEPTLQALAGKLHGADLGRGKKLKASWQNLRTFYYRWKSRGKKASALLPAYKSPAHIEQVPADLEAEIQRLASMPTGGRDKHQKGPDSTRIHARLEADWKSGKPIAGLGTWQEWWQRARPALPLPLTPPSFPFSVKSVSRRIGTKVVRKMGNIGIAAAKKHLPHMRRDYSKLRKCELITLDDVRADLVALDDITGRVVEVTLYVLQDVASRSIIAFILKPSDAIKAEDVDELLAWGLQADGFGIGDGYETHIWFERGTVACSEAAQRVLEAGSDGGIVVHRTSMDEGIRWIGSAADKASGHSAGKATIEAFNKKLHARLIWIKGQRGNNRDNQPANLGVGEAEKKDPSKRRAADTLKSAAEALGQFRATALMNGDALDLQLPLLLVSELQQEVAGVIRAYNAERGHGMQGFHKITEAEIAPDVWREVGTF